MINCFLHCRGYNNFTIPRLTVVEINDLINSFKKSVTEKDYKWFHSEAMLLK